MQPIIDVIDGFLARLSDWTGDSPFLQALLIAVGALALARLVDVVLSRWVARLLSRTETDADDRLLELLHRPVFVTVFGLGLTLATRRLALGAGYELATVRAVHTIVILVWIGAMFRASALVLDVLGRNQHRFQIVEEKTLPLFGNLSKVILFLFGVYAVLRVWSIDATALLTSAGIVGIALGFAAKDTLANLFSGIFILADAPYKIGDFIILDSGERGRVTAVGLRSTRMLTRDDIEITVPNAVIANAKIINETAGPYEKERIRVKVGVAYGSDVDRVCQLLQDIAVTHDHVCMDPEPRVRFRTFGNSGLDFELLAWIDNPIDRGRMVHELSMEVYKTFRREGVEIPYPKRDVYLYPQPPQEE